MILLMFGACKKPQALPTDSATFEELSEQGRSLCRQGNYVEGLRLLQEANDKLATMHPDSIDPTETVMFLGNIANLYVRMGLYAEAKQIHTYADDIAVRHSLDIRADLWRMRSLIYENCGLTDSMFFCRQRCLEFSDRIDDENYRAAIKRCVNTENAFYFIEHPDYAPDSIPGALATLEKNLSETEFGSQYISIRFLIGRAHVLLGEPSKGLPMMEKALAMFRQTDDKESVEWGLQLLAESYAMTDNRKLLDIYAEAAGLHDSIMHGRRGDLLLGMDFSYRTSQLEQDKVLLQNELKTEKLRNIFVTVIVILVCIVLVAFFIMHNRNYRRQLRLKELNIDTLLSERIALNSRIEELNNAIHAGEVDPQRHEILQSILLEKEDEQQFRKIFNDLHPGFVDRLRREFPNLTPGNELLCMLIALNRRNDEIALALGISRDSLATSRSRLRARLNLPKETDLDNFIQSRT